MVKIMKNKKNKLKKNSFIEGTIIASISIIVAKILGVLYVIPFYSIIGEDGGVLYSYAYNIYTFFLNISTAGIPIAISMIISEYDSLEMYDAKERSFKIAKKLVLTISVIAFCLLFIFSDYFALWFLHGVEGGNDISDIGLCIKAISTCILIAPFIAVLRGYLQGNKFIAPGSISQVIEQVARIVVVLVGSYLVIHVLGLGVSKGVSVALLGAFVGAVVAYCYLKFKINKNKSAFAVAKKADKISNKEILKKIVTYSIPLIVISVINDLYYLIDMKLIIKGLYMIGYDASLCELISSIISTWGLKICMIIIALAMGLETSLMPHLVSSYVKGDFKDVNHKFNQAINTMLVIAIPMSVGIFLLKDEVYTLFYGASQYGGEILGLLSISTIFLGLSLILNTALQGIKKFKLIYVNVSVGLVVNAILDIPLILLFNKVGIPPYFGTIVATIIGNIVSFIIIFVSLKKEMKFSYRPILVTLKKMILPLLLMVIVILPIVLLTKPSLDNRIFILIHLIVVALIGACIYFFLMYRNKGLEEALGSNFLERFKRKK